MNTYLTKDGKEFIVRIPEESDALEIMDYSKLVFASTDQVLNTVEEYTITEEYEKAWINNFNQNENALLLIAEIDDEIAGLLFFMPGQKKKIAHTGEFGVSVHPQYRGLGIGKVLVSLLIEWARKNPNIEKIFLNAFSTNTTAINLYKSLGFVEEGRHVKAIKQPSGEYVDILQMYLIIDN